MRDFQSLVLPSSGYEVQRVGGTLTAPLQVHILSLDRDLQFKGIVTQSDLLRFEKAASMPDPPRDGVPAPRRGLEFSPTEAAILEVMTRDWQVKQDIADACKLPLSSQFCALLTNLVDRQYLESGHKGYRLM